MLQDKDLLENDCELSVRAWVYELPEGFQKIAIKAIQDLKEENYSGEGIDTAVHKKSVGQGVKQGTMGLMGNNRFQANVYRQIERNHDSQKINTDDFLGSKSEIEDYLYELKKLGD